MPFGMQVSLGPGHIVLDGDPDPAPTPPRKAHSSPLPLFGPCLLWQMAGCIKIPLGTEVGLGPGDVLDGDPAAPMERATTPPHFSAHFALAQSPISAELLYYCNSMV